jgi:integrase
MLASNGDYVFAPRGGAIKGHALAVAMRRMADRLPGDHPGAGTWKADPPTPHDLRRTCATRLAALGIPGEDVSAVLNHVRADVTGRHYDHYARAREKRIALTKWATEVARILEPGQGGEIVPLRRERTR